MAFPFQDQALVAIHFSVFVRQNIYAEVAREAKFTTGNN
jgi:hypothetical protein